MTMTDKLRKNPLYRESRASLEYSARNSDMDKHLFEAWTMLLALEDHINAAVSESHVEEMLAQKRPESILKSMR